LVDGGLIAQCGGRRFDALPEHWQAVLLLRANDLVLNATHPRNIEAIGRLRAYSRDRCDHWIIKNRFADYYY